MDMKQIKEKLEKIGKETERILCTDIFKLLKETKYGKPLYTLEIRPKITTHGLSKDNIDYLYWVQEQGYKRGYFGSHTVTSKGLLIKQTKRPHEQRLERKVVDYDLGFGSNSADVLTLDIVDRVPITDDHGFLANHGPPRKVGECFPHIHLDNKIYDIKRTKLGLQLA